MDGIKTPIYHGYASTVKAIQTVVDYKCDAKRHDIPIDTTAKSRDKMAHDYSLTFVKQAKERLGADSSLVHFVFTPEELFNAFSEIKQNE